RYCWTRFPRRGPHPARSAFTPPVPRQAAHPAPDTDFGGSMTGFTFPPLPHLPMAAPPSWHHFAGLLLVILLAVLQARVGRAGAFWQICWALPGTTLHELAHLLVAAVTGGRPVGFSIIPHREPGR